MCFGLIIHKEERKLGIGGESKGLILRSFFRDWNINERFCRELKLRQQQEGHLGLCLGLGFGTYEWGFTKQEGYLQNKINTFHTMSESSGIHRTLWIELF
jgi:hypothetical protein